MSTAVATPPATPTVTARKGKLSFPHLLRSEWIKFWSVRSTFWTLAIFLFTVVALVVLITLAIHNAPPESQGGPSDADRSDPLNAFQAAVYLGQFAVAILGALTITGEYTTGMIRTSLTAAPKRLPVLWSKGLVAALSMLAFSLVTVAASAGLQWLFFNGVGIGVDLGNSQQVRALFGTALYIATIGVLAFAFGALMRHSAAAVSTILGLLLVIPIIFAIVPWKPLKYVEPFLPGSAGQSITMTDAQIAQNVAGTVGAHLTAWQGYGVLVAWVVVVLGVAAYLLKRRDA
ncbi:ABC transporter permease subunit [Cellulomonas sp. McL0617]|uniref:ABC transporter permease subunit n=1 Tax=Cellulomonas sp. McL0617 TaxID=3415675 RepID=UPI003CF71C0D